MHSASRFVRKTRANPEIERRLSSLEDRRTVAIHADPTQRFARRIGSSGEGSPVLADVNRDGVLDIVYGANDGRVHVLRGRYGRRLPGFPAQTESLLSRARFEASPAWYQRRVPVPREALVAGVRGLVGYQGLTGDISCNESGECNTAGPTFFIVEDGAWVEAP